MIGFMLDRFGEESIYGHVNFVSGQVIGGHVNLFRSSNPGIHPDNAEATFFCFVAPLGATQYRVYENQFFTFVWISLGVYNK